MKIYTDIEQGTEEWLKLRAGKFTASDALAIATNGAGLITLCFEKVAERETGLPARKEYTNEDIERGREKEEIACSAYDLETNQITTKVAFVEKNEWVGCSPDRLVGEDGLLEVKCPGDGKFVQYRYDRKIESKYYQQMQMQLLITDRKWCDYAVFNEKFPKQIIITRVERDEAAIEKLRIGLEAGEEKVKEILSRI